MTLQDLKEAKDIARFLAMIEIVDSGCWEGVGHTVKGYRYLQFGGKRAAAHRLSYELFNSEIPEGLHIDHLCRNRKCINPKHLEPVTCKENIRRGDTGKYESSRTHCIHGHPFDAVNTWTDKCGKRHCKVCQRDRQMKYKMLKTGSYKYLNVGS